MRVSAPGEMVLLVQPYLTNSKAITREKPAMPALGGAVVCLAEVTEQAGHTRKIDDATACAVFGANVVSKGAGTAIVAF